MYDINQCSRNPVLTFTPPTASPPVLLNTFLWQLHLCLKISDLSDSYLPLESSIRSIISQNNMFGLTLQTLETSLLYYYHLMTFILHLALHQLLKIVEFSGGKKGTFFQKQWKQAMDLIKNPHKTMLNNRQIFFMCKCNSLHLLRMKDTYVC